MIQLSLLTEELGRNITTINYWIVEDAHIEKIRTGGKTYISDEDANVLRKISIEKRRIGSNNKSGKHFAKNDVNYNWRRGFPTRITPGGFR